jgi:integrase/recombinase XerD
MATTSTFTSTSTVVAIAEPVFTSQERLALAGFLAGYTGLTREAYALDLRQYATWCHQRHVRLFEAAALISSASPVTWKPKAGRGQRSPAGCARSPGSTGTRWKKTCLIILPAAHVRRPRLDYDSHATGLDRNDLGAMLVAAGLGPAQEYALISLLALNGLRVSEATGASIEALGTERGHRTLTITRKGGKVVTIPLAPRTARAIDLAIGERCEGPILSALTAGGWTGTAPRGSSAASPAAPGSPRSSVRTHSDMHSSLPLWMLACRCATCRKPPPTLTRVPRSATTVAGPHSTGTPPT